MLWLFSEVINIMGRGWKYTGAKAQTCKGPHPLEFGPYTPSQQKPQKDSFMYCYISQPKKSSSILKQISEL